jgi:hypothetical protein
MFVCFVCKDSKSCDVKQLFRHFKEAHYLLDRYDKYVCCQGSCSRMYTDKFIFSKHLSLEHSDSISAPVQIISPPKSLISSALPNDCNDKIHESADEQPMCKRQHLDITGLAAKYIGQCKASTGTLQQASLIAKSCNSLVGVIISDLEDDALQLKQICSTNEQQTVVNSLLQKMEMYSSPFEGLVSEYSFRAYIEKSGYYVSPKQFCIGSYNASVLQPSTGYVNSSKVDNTGQYISIASMITALHTNTDLIKMLLLRDTRPCIGNENELHSFLDGLHWQRHPLVNEKVLLIRLYGDDFEPCNVLGSHRTLYKIGTIYFQFECMPVSR